MKIPKLHTAETIVGGQTISGSLLYDIDNDQFCIVTNFFDIDEPKTQNQFGVNGVPVKEKTIKPMGEHLQNAILEPDAS